MRSTRSTTAPPMGGSTTIGRAKLKPSSPSQSGESVSCSTSQPVPTPCIQVPTFEKNCPPQISRKLRCCNAEKRAADGAVPVMLYSNDGRDAGNLLLERFLYAELEGLGCHGAAPAGAGKFYLDHPVRRYLNQFHVAAVSLKGGADLIQCFFYFCRHLLPPWCKTMSLHGLL